MLKNYCLRADERQSRTCTDGLNIVRSSESAPILILAGSPVSCFKLFSVLRKNGFPAPCPTQSPHLSCSREKETSERENSGADGGAVNGTATVIPCAEIKVHLSMSRSSFTRQSENAAIVRTLRRALKLYINEIVEERVVNCLISHGHGNRGTTRAQSSLTVDSRPIQREISYQHAIGQTVPNYLRALRLPLWVAK
jgi:hypothetical protein